MSSLVEQLWSTEPVEYFWSCVFVKYPAHLSAKLKVRIAHSVSVQQ